MKFIRRFWVDFALALRGLSAPVNFFLWLYTLKALYLSQIINSLNCLYTLHCLANNIHKSDGWCLVTRRI